MQLGKYKMAIGSTYASKSNYIIDDDHTLGPLDGDQEDPSSHDSCNDAPTHIHPDGNQVGYNMSAISITDNEKTSTDEASQDEYEHLDIDEIYDKSMNNQ